MLFQENKMKILFIAILLATLSACSSVNPSVDVSGSVDGNLNINTNECEVAQSDGILYVFNRSTTTGTLSGIAIDSSTLYDVIPYPLDIVDTYRTVPYTAAETAFLEAN